MITLSRTNTEKGISRAAGAREMGGHLGIRDKSVLVD